MTAEAALRIGLFVTASVMQNVVALWDIHLMEVY